MPICQKNANKQRKAFDSSKQRAEGTEIATVPKSKARVSEITNNYHRILDLTISKSQRTVFEFFGILPKNLNLDFSKRRLLLGLILPIKDLRVTVFTNKFCTMSHSQLTRIYGSL